MVARAAISCTHLPKAVQIFQYRLQGTLFELEREPARQKASWTVECNAQNLFRPDLGNLQSVVSAQRRQSLSNVRQDDMESVDSASSDKMIIRKTTAWSLRYEYDRPLGDASGAPHENPRMWFLHNLQSESCMLNVGYLVSLAVLGGAVY
jgi:hypothetical protein